MSVVIAVAILACLGFGAGLVFAVRRVACPAVALPATLDWIDELSTDRYRPMLRLLSDDEFRFLGNQDGMSPKLAAQFRRQRCQIFRGYLRSLSRDYSRVSIALKLLMMQANTDRPDLAEVLVRGRLAFTFAMLMAHTNLTLYSFGLGNVNVSELLRLFDGMRVELRSLVPCEMSAAA